MTRVLLIHAGLIPHYRIPIYSYLRRDLGCHGFDLMVAADGIQPDNPLPVNFPCRLMRLSTPSLVRLIQEEDIGIIIDYMELRHRYLFPVYLAVKGMPKRRIIYWGQGRDLLNPDAWIKNLAYWLELALCDSIILYAGHLKKHVPRRFRYKVFIANNTLHLSYGGLSPGMTKKGVLAGHGIRTAKNIICIGRMQKRKRLGHLANAHALMNRPDIGLIFVGPDPEGALADIEGDTVYKLGPLYGNEKFDLLTSADVYCLPGAVGLGIVDAFHCGLPLVTEKGDESAEIMYLKDGVNGFAVPRGDVRMMSEKLMLLLDDVDLRERFSEAARKEIREHGSMENFCSGFREALLYAARRGIERGRKGKVG